MVEDNKIKICLLTPGEYPVPATEGGAVENLTEILAENFQFGDYDCSLDIISKYTSDAAKQSQNYGKVDFYFIKTSALSRFIYQFIMRAIRKVFGVTVARISPFFSKALKIIRKNRYDIVVSENALFFVNPLKKYCNSKVVFHLHNDYYELTDRPANELLKGADLVISVSNFVTDNLKRVPDLNISLATVKNVIDTKHFSKTAENQQIAKKIRKKCGFSDDDIVCLFVGRLVEEKGVGHLVDAIGKIDNDRIKLLIVGGSAFGDSQQTEFVKELHRKAEQIKDKVFFAGYIGYEELPPYYHACDIAVFPSQLDEAAGLVVLEAQSAEKPVIIAKSGGMPEYVNGKSAIVVDKGDDFTENLAKEIADLSGKAKEREEMGREGKILSQNFDKNDYFKNFISALNI